MLIQILLSVALFVGPFIYAARRRPCVQSLPVEPIIAH